MDRFKGLTKKAENAAATHKEQIDQAVQKVETAADQRTGGKYHDQIQKAGAKAESVVDRLPPTDAETRPASGAGEPPASSG
ncbi:MAG TPA: antitoxin [Solirubrobacteraceae bacterium]|nr:antitoxin [Solirubrobacteraceae bacterium]